MSIAGQQPNETSHPGTILIVEDNPLISAVMRSLLQSAGFSVHHATNGEEGLNILHVESVDVIICDVMMPRMDGYEFHSQVRQRAECAHIPFIFLTALDDDTEKQRGLLSGADMYLTKPFDPAAMVPLVSGKVTRSRALKATTTEQFNSFRKKVVNTLSHEFRTPLVAITTGSELLMDHSHSLDTARVQSLIEAIRRGGSRLEKLVNDFMLLQQLELGVGKKMYEARGKVAALKPLLEQVLETKFCELGTLGFTSWSRLEIDDVSIYFYPPHLEDLLLRLIDNAAKFSRERKEIVVTAHADEEWVTITVLDRGIGVDPECTKLSLELFGQVDRDKWEQQGTGIGLALVRRYLDLLGGTIELSPREEGGSVAKVRIPRRTGYA